MNRANRIKPERSDTLPPSPNHGRRHPSGPLMARSGAPHSRVVFIIVAIVILVSLGLIPFAQRDNVKASEVALKTAGSPPVAEAVGAIEHPQTVVADHAAVPLPVGQPVTPPATRPLSIAAQPTQQLSQPNLPSQRLPPFPLSEEASLRKHWIQPRWRDEIAGLGQSHKRSVLNHYLGLGLGCGRLPFDPRPGKFHDVYVSNPHTVTIIFARTLQPTMTANSFNGFLVSGKSESGLDDSNESIKYGCEASFRYLVCSASIPQQLRLLDKLTLTVDYRNEGPIRYTICNPFSRNETLPPRLLASDPPPTIPLRPPFRLVYASSPLTHMGPFLRQFVEYHLLVGVEHFFLYDQESDAMSYREMQPYVDEGLVTWVPWSFRKGYIRSQTEQMNHANKRYALLSEWLLLTDLDEYVVPIKHDKITDYLEDYVTARVCAIQMLSYGFRGTKAKISNTTQRAEILAERYRTGGLIKNQREKLLVRSHRVNRMKTIHKILEDEPFDRWPMKLANPEHLVFNHYFNSKFNRSFPTVMGAKQQSAIDRFVPHLKAALTRREQRDGQTADNYQVET